MSETQSSAAETRVTEHKAPELEAQRAQRSQDQDAEARATLARLAAEKYGTPAPDAPEESEAEAEPKAEAPTEQGVEQAEEGGHAPSEEPGEDQGDADDPDMLEAFAALRRDGFSSEDLRLMPRKRLLELGRKRAKSQRDVDDKLTERSQLVQKLKDLEESKGAVEPGAAEPAGHATSATLDEATMRSFRDALAEAIGDDEQASKVGDALSQMLQAASSPLAQRTEVLGGAFMKLLDTSARRDLSDTYGATTVREKWPAVRAKAHELLDLPSYSSEDGVTAAYEDAARLVLGDPRVDPGLSKSESGSRRNGQPTVPQTKAKATPATREEVELEVFRAVNKGDIAEANRLGAKLDNMR